MENPEQQPWGNDNPPNSAENFECNICYDICREPVVTTCGHLFCWPCIYQWIFSNRTHVVCPVCKNGISEHRIVSIYTKSDGETHA